MTPRLALYQPDIPQNMGAAIRLTACLGVPLDIIEPCAFPLLDKSLRRTAMDYSGLADIRRWAGWQSYREAMRDGGRRIVLMTTRGAESMERFTFRADDVILMGSESSGVDEDVHAQSDARVYIPLTLAARCLNVVSAASIAVFEALRQTRGLPAGLADQGSSAGP